MKAIGFYKHGKSSELKEIELQTPKPQEKEVLIKLEMTSINALDIMVRNGIPGVKFNMPHIPGMDVLGRVVSSGSKASLFNEGDIIIANTVYGCGTCIQCNINHEERCPSWKCLGLDVNGSYGEYISLPEKIISLAPQNFSKTELAAMPLHTSFAWHNIKELGQAKEGETILIRGASGSVGLFSIMFAKALKLNIIAITSKERAVHKIKQLGASAVIVNNDENKKDILKEVMSLTDGKGADIILESLGSKLGESVDSAGYNARIISFGVVAGSESTLNIRKLYLKNITIKGTHNASKEEFDKAFEFASKNNIHPIINKVFDITDVQAAHELFEEHKDFGKIILKHWD